jgi:two-component system cell cycle sensor histidine kinase/response regulator CckA
VRIYLPTVEVRVEQAKKAKIEMAATTGNILVIENEDVVIDAIGPILERLGYHMLVAKTGKEAVDVVKTFDWDIDLVLLDIVLPDMRGKDVFSLIIGARPSLKVIVCSEYALDGPAQEVLDAGAQDFIQKPFSFETLSEKLKEVLRG